MIRVTGDTHGERDRFSDKMMEGMNAWTEDDYLIVTGDFGFVFLNNEYEASFLDYLETLPFTICFCDGNHENFAAIYKYPVEQWNGGFIHRIRKNVIHLDRGQVFEIDGKKFFTFGGAYSRDRYLRIKDLSYWEEELPSDDDYKEANKNLKKHGYKVDYVITHTAPQSVILVGLRRALDKHDAELTGYFDWLKGELEFKRWFFGHWHEDKSVMTKFRALWFDVEEIG